MHNETVRSSRRRTDLLTWMSRRHGVAHTSDARANGFTAYDIREAVTAGTLMRVRRSWLVTPDCDRRRVAAARVSGRLTCISAATARGLWTADREALTVHVAVASTASRFSADGLHLHWGTGPAPVGRNAIEDPILNVLFHVAHCLPTSDALAVWESAARKGEVDPGVLSQVAWRSTQASELATLTSSLSDSGLETRFVHGMRTAGVVVHQQVWIDGHPVDGLIGTSLVVQIDGFAHHSTPADRRRDLAADARLTVRGYVVLRFDYRQILFEWDRVVDIVVTAIAQGSHRRRVHPHR